MFLVLVGILLLVFGIVIFRRRRQISNSHSKNHNPSKPVSHNPYQQQSTSLPTKTNLQSSVNPNLLPFKFSPKRPSILDGYKITIVETIDACEEFLATKVPDPVTIVGLDCEWRSGGLNKFRNATPSVCEDLDLTEEESEGLEGKRISTYEGLVERVRSDCPVALLQLAFSNGELVLVRLCKMEGIGERLRNMLSDRR